MNPLVLPDETGPIPGPGRFQLACGRCGWSRLPGSMDYGCVECGGALVARFAGARQVPPAGSGVGSMWRYADRLPLLNVSAALSLGEGGTPVVAVPSVATDLGVRAVLVKCEHLNPTGSFKDRIAAVAVSIARERGLRGLVGTSSGNGGAAAAAYAARAGLSLTVFSLAQPAAAKVDQIRALGATIVLVEGLGADAQSTESAAQEIARHAAAHDRFPFLTGGRFSPEAMEGAKTIAYEIAEQVPHATAVYAPVGGGGLVAAIGRGLRDTGGSTTRIVAVQPFGCATVRDALAGGAGRITGDCDTAISGLQVPVMFDRDGVLDALSASGGHLTEVDDGQVWAAQHLLARQAGVLVEPAGAAALAGAFADAAAGRLRPDDVVVLLATGAGYKDGDALRRLAGETTLRRIGVDGISAVLDED